MTQPPADARPYAEANALRNDLLLKKLDPLAEWVQHRHPEANGYAITVARRGEDIIKTLRGFMEQLQEHELSAYVEVFMKRQSLPRIATFRRLEGRDSDLSNTLVLRDYGPDLLNWLHLLTPPRLEAGYFDPTRPERSHSLGPWLHAPALLSLARALLEALSPFHRAGFVHCDIKPDNFCIRHRLTPGQSIRLDAPVAGELDLDSLTAIDLGCALLPSNHRRVIHHTLQGQPLYIGGTLSKRRDYTWPALFAAQDEATARKQAARLLAGEPPHGDGRIRKPREIAYVSDHYLLCCELAELGHTAALERLDWRIDFHSLGHLLRGLLRHLGQDREIKAERPEQLSYLEALPERLMAYDTSPFTPAPPPPHAELVQEINDLIGASAYRRIAFTAIGNANPTQYFDVPPETAFTELAPAYPKGGETLLREPRQGPGQPFAEFRDFSEAPQLITLPAASAWLGAPLDEPGRKSDEPQPYQADIASCALGKYPVSFAEWDEFLRATGQIPPEGQDQGWGRDARPVILIAPQDIAAYIAWLNQIGGWAADDPHRYRLPTAQEWEYAARANTRTPYHSGDSLHPEEAHYFLRPAPANLPPRDRTAPVGHYPANPWGFHDLLGNVWEYVQEGSGYSLRGGSWLNGPALLRAAARLTPPTGGRGAHIGFRVARSLGRRG